MSTDSLIVSTLSNYESLFWLLSTAERSISDQSWEEPKTMHRNINNYKVFWWHDPLLKWQVLPQGLWPPALEFEAELLYQVWNSTLLSTCKTNQKAVCWLLPRLHATNALDSASCLACQYCSRQCAAFVKTIHFFSNLSSLYNIFRYYKRYSTARKLLVSLRLISLCPAANLYSVFSNGSHHIEQQHF